MEGSRTRPVSAIATDNPSTANNSVKGLAPPTGIGALARSLSFTNRLLKTRSFIDKKIDTSKTSLADASVSPTTPTATTLVPGTPVDSNFLSIDIYTERNEDFLADWTKLNSLQRAVMEDDPHKAQSLIQQDSKRVDKSDHFCGFTALYLAAFFHRLELVKLLLNEKANIDCTDNKLGRTALMAAVIMRHKDVIQLLTSKRADVNVKDHWGCTALHYALFCSSPESLSTLLRSGGDATVVDNSGIGLLHHAARLGKLQMVEALVKSGVDINYVDSEGRPAVFFAVQSSNFELVKFMSENGANLAMKDHRGNTVIDFFDFGHYNPDIWEILKPFMSESTAVSPMPSPSLLPQASPVQEIPSPIVSDVSFSEIQLQVPSLPTSAAPMMEEEKIGKLFEKLSTLESYLLKITSVQNSVPVNTPSSPTSISSPISQTPIVNTNESDEKQKLLEKIDVLSSRIAKMTKDRTFMEKNSSALEQAVKHLQKELQVKESLISEFETAFAFQTRKDIGQDLSNDGDEASTSANSGQSFISEFKDIMNIIGSKENAVSLRKDITSLNSMLHHLENTILNQTKIDNSIDFNDALLHMNEILSSMKMITSGINVAQQPSSTEKPQNEQESLNALYLEQLTMISSIFNAYQRDLESLITSMSALEAKKEIVNRRVSLLHQDSSSEFERSRAPSKIVTDQIQVLQDENRSLKDLIDSKDKVIDKLNGGKPISQLEALQAKDREIQALKSTIRAMEKTQIIAADGKVASSYAQKKILQYCKTIETLQIENMRLRSENEQHQKTVPVSSGHPKIQQLKQIIEQNNDEHMKLKQSVLQSQQAFIDFYQFKLEKVIKELNEI